MRVLRVIFFVLAVPLFVFAQSANTSNLTGTVYDAQGSVVVGVEVTAVAADGKTYSTITNAEGVYSLTLPYHKYVPTLKFKEAVYDLIIEPRFGFQRSETKGFVFVPSHFGKMTFDIGLKVGCDDCHSIEVPAAKIGKKQ